MFATSQEKYRVCATPKRDNEDLALKSSGWSVFICSLNVVMILFSYQVGICFLRPIMGANLEAGPVAVVIRACAFVVCGIALFFAPRHYQGRWNGFMRLLAFFWILYLIRAFYDLEIRTEYVTDQIFPDRYADYPFSFIINGGASFPQKHLRLWLFAIPMTLFPVYTVYQTFRSIDFSLAFSIARKVLTVAALFAVLSMQISWRDANRMDMGVLLNSISFGQFGNSIFILGMAGESGRFGKKDWCSWLLMILGAWISLQSGSRGAVFTLGYLLLFVLIARNRSPFKLSFKLVTLWILLWISSSAILELLSEFASGAVNRVILSDPVTLLGRGEIYWRFLEKCREYPWLGFQTDLFGYSHNAVIDGFMMFGFIFGWINLVLIICAIYSAFKQIQRGEPHIWVSLLTVQFIFYGMASGAFGSNPILQPLLVMCFLLFSEMQSRANAVAAPPAELPKGDCV